MSVLKEILADGVNVENIVATGKITQAGIFGGIHVHDNSTPQSIPTGTTYTKITSFTDNNESSNVTSDATNDKITITTPGCYQLTGSFSFSSGTSNVIYWVAPFLDGVEKESIHFKRKVSVAGDVGAASLNGVINVATAPIDIDVRVRHNNVGSINFTLEYANLNVVYLGD